VCGQGADVYSFVNFFVRMSGAILANYARLIRDIHRDTVEIWKIHGRFSLRCGIDRVCGRLKVASLFILEAESLLIGEAESGRADRGAG
jgi:hypothetical protein